MNPDSPRSRGPVWPCMVESTDCGLIVRDGNDRVATLPAFHDACRDRALVLRHAAIDSALRNGWDLLRRCLRPAALARHTTLWSTPRSVVENRTGR